METAQNILDIWESGEKTEKSMIALMNEFGSDQGGGQLWTVKPMDCVAEIDAWCFDKNRKVGDVAIIANVYGYTICYFSCFIEK